MSTSPPESRKRYLQANQPAGVPPLPLTGERTLPDVPEENYWYRRHLVVYEWIARAGRRACGSSTWPAARATAPTCSPAAAAEVVGVDANPEAHEHARLRYVRPNLRFERDLVESFAEPCDAVVFLQTIEHVQDAGRDPRALQVDARAGRRRLRLDPEPADPGAARGGEVRQPLARARVPRRRSSASSASRTSAGSSCSASSTPASCACTSCAIKLGWDRVHKRCGLTKPFYDRFTPAIAASDFALGEARRTSTRRWTSSPSAAA